MKKNPMRGFTGIHHFFSSVMLLLLLRLIAAGQTSITFPDANLSAAVQSALHKTNASFTATELSALTNLSVTWQHVTNLSGLEFATNLEKLVLYYANPASLSPLAALPRLRTLALEHAYPENLQTLPSLINLTNLDLFSSTLTNLAFLTPLTNLTSLDVSFTQVADPSPLAALPQLHLLDFSGNRLGDCAKLGLLTNLSGTLYLDNASLTNLEALRGLTNLAQLTLYQNPLQDVTALSNLTCLTALDLGYVPVQDFSCLAALTNLQLLLVNETQLTNLSRLPPLPLLTTLDATYNRLDDPAPLARWPKLQWLSLSCNHLTNLAPLPALTNLATVYLPFNLLDTNDGPTMTAIATLTNRGVQVLYAPQHQPPALYFSGPFLVPANEVSSLPFSAADDLTPGDQLLLDHHSLNPAVATAVLSPTPVPAFSGSAVSILSEQWVFPVPPNLPSIPARYGYLNVSPAPNQTGPASFTLSATDETGRTTQTNFTITVAQPLPFDGLGVGGASPNLTWRTFGSAPWQPQSTFLHAAPSAAQSGSPDSWLEALATGPGSLLFWWRCAGSNWSDGATLTAFCPDSDLTGHARLSPSFSGGNPGLIDWQPLTLSLPAGRWFLRWQACSSPFAPSPVTVWVTETTFTPGPPPAWLTASPTIYPTGFFSFLLNGPPGETFDLEASSDLLTWTQVNRITLTDFSHFSATAQDTSPGRFFRLRPALLAPLWLESPALDPNHNLQLTLHSEPQQPLRLESTTNLVDWTTLCQTNNQTGVLLLNDDPASAPAQKFYRAKALPWGHPLGSPSPQVPLLPRRHPPGLTPPPPSLPGLPTTPGAR